MKKKVQGENLENAMAKYLGEPFMSEFTESVRKMRTHLLIGAVIAIAAVFMDLTINPDSPVFGVQFKGLSERKILIGLFLINLYLLVHFFWSSLDSYREWEIRLTGYENADVLDVPFYNDQTDFAKDPRQSTLYNWWLKSARQIQPLDEMMRNLIENIDSMIASGTQIFDPPRGSNFNAEMGKVRSELDKIDKAMETVNTTLTNSRLVSSLALFDTRFRHFHASQNLRWILIEWLLPIGIGLLALCGLIWKLQTA